MKPQSAKAKGRRLQQEVRDALLAAFPDLQPDDIRSTSMGASGEDILLSPAARSVIPFSIECKCQEALNIWDAIKQANTGKHPGLVIFRRNNVDAQVVLAFTEFMKLLQISARYAL